MSPKPLASIEACFGALEDPRVAGRCSYPLIEIMTIAICGVIAGAETWTDIETFGESKVEWLKGLLTLEHGIPSHDTFGDVFSALDGESFERSFIQWVEAVFKITKGQVVSIDGKTARRSHDQAIGKDAIHMVSAWASANGISLGQRKVDDKSNEITAIPALLELLNISGCLVTIDAMGCQKKIAQTIRDGKADYLLAVKANQEHLHQDIQDWFAYADQVTFKDITHDYAKAVSKGHGRLEIRECWVIADPIAFEYIRHFEGWVDLNAIVRVRRERRFNGKVEHNIAYYITSSSATAKIILTATRHHWAIENSLHWVLDVIFGDDLMRIRSGNSSQNMVILRHIALNILKKDPSKKSLKQKRYQAALDDNFLLHLLQLI
jgi:predicted transposase YbfD/YdcC